MDGVLAILTPQAMTKPLEVAKSLIEAAGNIQQAAADLLDGRYRRSWRGAPLLPRPESPSFRTPEPAVEVFSYLSAYYRNQRLLTQIPAPSRTSVEPDVEGARMVIEGALAERRKVLIEMESKALLSAFHIPVAKTMVARSPNEALLIAEQLGLPGGDESQFARHHPQDPMPAASCST